MRKLLILCIICVAFLFGCNTVEDAGTLQSDNLTEDDSAILNETENYNTSQLDSNDTDKEDNINNKNSFVLYNTVSKINNIDTGILEQARTKQIRKSDLKDIIASEPGIFGGSDVIWYTWIENEIEYHGVEYIGSEDEQVTVVSSVLISDSNIYLGNGVSIGMNEEELTRLYPELYLSNFDEEDVEAVTRSQYPPQWLSQYDYGYLAWNGDIPDDELPELIVFLIKEGRLSGITICYPTAG